MDCINGKTTDFNDLFNVIYGYKNPINKRLDFYKTLSDIIYVKQELITLKCSINLVSKKKHT